MTLWVTDKSRCESSILNRNTTYTQKKITEEIIQICLYVYIRNELSTFLTVLELIELKQDKVWGQRDFIGTSHLKLRTQTSGFVTCEIVDPILRKLYSNFADVCIKVYVIRCRS